MDIAEPADLLPLDPRVRMLWWCAGAVWALPALLLAAAVDVFAPLPLPPALLSLVVLGVVVVVAGIGPALRFSRWRYALRSEDLWIRRGVVWTTTSVIPYARLQFVDTRQGPLDRMFGLSQLVVHTAAVGTSGHLPGLDTATAERLRERLSRTEADDSTV